MLTQFEILTTQLLESFRKRIGFDIEHHLYLKSKKNTPFDYFPFYTSTSSVYSSKIEGESIEMDSFLKHKFLNIAYEPDYTKRADDLFAAYQFLEQKKLKKKNVLKAHEILSQNLLAKSQRGVIRTNPMFVMNEDNRIEYVACEPNLVMNEWNKLFRDIKKLKNQKLDIQEVFYFASLIHLVFLKIHPLQDGNGRTGRLLEKWFLKEKLGSLATSIELEKNYYLNKQNYYDNIRKLGMDYDTLDYSNALDFLLMTVESIKL